MQTLKNVAQAARRANMQPVVVQARNAERLALNAAIDRATVPHALCNHTEPRQGKSSAICECCAKQSRPVPVDADGEPDLWKMARGWSTAPFPADFVHRNGSVGSTFTCPACNTRLRNGEALQLRVMTVLRVQ